MVVATATEFQNNFGKYAKLVGEGEEVVVLKRGVEIGRFVSPEKKREFLTSSLRGILKGDYDDKEAARERIESGLAAGRY